MSLHIAFDQAFPSGFVTPPGSGPAQSVLNPSGGALGQ